MIKTYIFYQAFGKRHIQIMTEPQTATSRVLIHQYCAPSSQAVTGKEIDSAALAKILPARGMARRVSQSWMSLPKSGCARSQRLKRGELCANPHAATMIKGAVGMMGRNTPANPNTNARQAMAK